MPGRPRKPTHLKLVSGTTRSHKKGAKPNNAEPTPAPATPDVPSTLTARAREHWPTFVKLLHGMGVLTEADGPALEHLVEAYADGMEARASLARPMYDASGAEVAQAGALVYVTTGNAGSMLRTRPEVAVINAADARFRGYLADFGLTPAARSKVQVKPPVENDPLDSYFSAN